MQLTLATSILALSALALAEADGPQHGPPPPQGAAAIESAVTSLASQTNLPADITSLAPALSSAGITGVVISGSAEPTGTSGSDSYGNEGQSGGQGQSGSEGESGNSGDSNENTNNNDDDDNNGDRNGASVPVPQVVVAGGAAGLGMAVLAFL